MQAKTIGSALLIAGTTLGGAMLALPLMSAGLGFPLTILVLIGLWFLMYCTALLTLEVNLVFPVGASFWTMAGATLGKAGQWVTVLTVIGLFYSLTAAYIAGGSGLIHLTLNNFWHYHLSDHWAAAFFTIILGGVVCFQAAAVDYINRGLIAAKFFFFFFVAILLFNHIVPSYLYASRGMLQFLPAGIPIFFTAFGFHGSIPSIVKYLENDVQKIKRVLFWGSFLPLCIYIVWEGITLGIYPRVGALSYEQLLQQQGTAADFIQALSIAAHNPWVVTGLNFFADIAVTTSFLGVTLGLYDFFQDLFRKTKTSTNISLAILATFVPPYFFVILYPNGFILALGYAAIALAILAVLLPVLMVMRQRQANQSEKMVYRVSINRSGLGIIFLMGLLIIVLQCLSNLHQLPLFGRS